MKRMTYGGFRTIVAGDRTGAMLEKVRAALRRSVDRAYDFNRFFKTPIRAYGVRYPVLRKLAESSYPENVDPADLARICDKLWQSGMHEESVVAIAWAKKGGIASIPLMKRWLHNYVGNWAQVDDLCLSVLCPLLEKDASWLAEIKRWAGSKNLWTRRASAVALVTPCRKGLYLQDCLEVATRLLLDNEDLVQKAYGWALREAGKKHPNEIFRFILKHKDVMGRTALRYAIELMPASMKRRAMRRST